MANQVFNIALGRMAEFYNRVDSNDPTNAALIVIAWVSTATDAVIKDLDDVAAVESDANTAEATNTNYARKVLTDNIDMDDFRVAVGAGLRISVPAMGPAPIAVDFAVPLAREGTDRIQNFSFFVGFGR